MKEPGHEEMRSTVEKEDFDVDYMVPVSLYRIDVQSFSLRGRVSVCHECRYMVRPIEGRLLLT